MMLESLKKEAFEANQRLVADDLVILTWGNASVISEDRRYIAIKPSGVDYDTMRPEQMVIVDMDGRIVEGELRPSSDLPTHLELYHQFPEVRSIVHTHSLYATALAQAELDLPCLGTTHADHFYGSVPCTRHLTADEIQAGYEQNTGKVIAEIFQERRLDPLATPGVLVCKHGPFTWGSDWEKAVENALVLEQTAHMAVVTREFDPAVRPAPGYLMDKHYFRKHGANAYYGQK